MSENLTPELVQQIRAEMGAGRKIQAIKIYIDATGSTLSEAKDFVEQINDGELMPNHSVLKTSKGCLGTLLWLILLGASTILAAQRFHFS
jgi:hypothetical protein